MKIAGIFMVVAVNAGVWDQCWDTCVKVVGTGACERMAEVFLRSYYPELLGGKAGGNQSQDGQGAGAGQDGQQGQGGQQGQVDVPPQMPPSQPAPSMDPAPSTPTPQAPANPNPNVPVPAPQEPSQPTQPTQEPTTDPAPAAPSPPGTGNPKDTQYEYLSEAQSGKTTRYWDCCKPSCAWPDKAKYTSPLKTCDASHNKLTDPLVQSGCNDGGDSYTCADQSPFMMGDVAYGFAAVSLSGQGESDWCCACYELMFTDKEVEGKKMIVQVTNTGGLADHHFDLMMPGGGMGDFIKGCAKQGEEQMGTVGKRYGGLENIEQCDVIKNADMRAGCKWRFGKWFRNADNPHMNYRKITCPKVLTDVSGCMRA